MTTDHVVRPSFLDVGPIEQLAPGTALVVTVGDHTIALFNANDQLYAIDNSCAQCESSLAAGKLQGQNVTCPGCGWQYDIATGQMTSLPALYMDTFEVRIVELRVMVAACLRPRPPECVAGSPR
jgi:3-phenylpropionate/trans-cinnamate dioxygenase ferredoxin component